MHASIDTQHRENKRKRHAASESVQLEQESTRLLNCSTTLFVDIHDSSMRLRPLHTDCRAEGVGAATRP
jgi:hypothetical protein